MAPAPESDNVRVAVTVSPVSTSVITISVKLNADASSVKDSAAALLVMVGASLPGTTVTAFYPVIAVASPSVTEVAIVKS